MGCIGYFVLFSDNDARFFCRANIISKKNIIENAQNTPNSPRLTEWKFDA